MQQKLFCFILLGLFLAGSVSAQQKTVSGKVTSSSNGEPLAGVSVIAENTGTGVTTGANGFYSITVPLNSTLTFRYIGYVQKKIKVGNNSTVNITLSSDEQSLEEVVVVGYGSGQKVGSIVGSVTTVGAADIAGRPTANALESLSGKVPGLQVFTSSGEPSATQSFRIRGVGSLGASSTPLVVLDGTPVDPNSIVGMNPEDFESITVLKDASSTSIYGSRAANGVLYITTKKGSVGETATITARSQLSWSSLATTKMQDNVMNSEELQNFWLETGFAEQADIYEIREAYPNDTKWRKYYFKDNVPLQQYDLNVSGGSEKTQYYISGGYLDQEGIMYRSGYDRATLRSNITSRLNNWLKAGLNLSGGYSRLETNGWGANSLNGGLSLLALPWYTPYDENGNEYYDQQIPGLGRYTPKYLADKNPSQGRYQQFNPTAYLEITPVSGLTIKSQAGMDYYNYRVSTRRLPSNLAALNQGTARESWEQKVLKTITNTAEYKFNVQEDHHFTLLAGHEGVAYRLESFNGSGEGLTVDDLTLLSATTQNKNVGQTWTEYAYNSFFGRLSYDWNDKYYLDASLRNDASSRFGKNKKNALFWSIGGMWNAKSESFLHDVDWLTDLKVKASVGTSGNSSLDDNYLPLATVSPSIYNEGTGFNIASAGNPNLQWEKQTMTNIGFVTTLFDRLNLDLQFFKRVTSSMLVDVPRPYTSGFSEITSNVGSMRSNGIDLAFSLDVFKSPDYYLTPYINIGLVNQKITELFDGKDYWIVPNTSVSWAVGKPVEFFTPVQAGVNPQTGLMEWYVPGDNIAQSHTDPNDVTSDFDENALQQSAGIKRYPPFNGGFGLASGFKGFFLNADFTFSQGKYLLNNDRYFFENPYQFAGYNQSKDVRDYWKQPGDVTKFPKYGEVNQFDSGLIENASFLRLKALTFGYELPKSVLSRIGFFKGGRIYYQGRNLFTVTKYLGPDPEIDSNLTYGAYPNTRQHGFGVELQF